MSNPHATASTTCPFIHRKLDHVVLRCKSLKTMVDWYIDVLGAAPDCRNWNAEAQRVI